MVESNRLKIWTNCLTRFDIENKKKLLRKLSSTEVNGREIGNLLDIIFTILKSKNENFLEEPKTHGLINYPYCHKNKAELWWFWFKIQRNLVIATTHIVEIAL